MAAALYAQIPLARPDDGDDEDPSDPVRGRGVGLESGPEKAGVHSSTPISRWNDVVDDF